MNCCTDENERPSERFGTIFKKSWTNLETTTELWTKVFEMLSKEEDSELIAEMGFAWRETLEKVSSTLKNYETCSLMNFVGTIFDTELYTRFMREKLFTTKQMNRLIEMFNDLSTEVSLSPLSTEITTTSSTIVPGVTAVADVLASDKSKILETIEEDADIIEKLLQPQLGTSSTGSICSSISIQQDDGLAMLKYPESRGYAIIEVHIGRCSKLMRFESNEQWKAYDYRTKLIVQSPLDPEYIQAMRLIRNISEKLHGRTDSKKTFFKRKNEDERRRVNNHKRRRHQSSEDEDSTEVWNATPSASRPSAHLSKRSTKNQKLSHF